MNWLGDSKPNFLAEISGILYAQFYASPSGDAHSGVSVPVWAHLFTATGPRLKPTSIFCRPARIAAAIANSCDENRSGR